MARLKWTIPAEERERLFKEQNGCCAVCGKPESYFKKKLAADHNHKTKKQRGLLCYACNYWKVGRFTWETIQPVYKYLRKYK